MCTPTHRRVAPPIAAPLFGNVNFLHVFKSITKMVLSNNSSDLDVTRVRGAAAGARRRRPSSQELNARGDFSEVSLLILCAYVMRSSDFCARSREITGSDFSYWGRARRGSPRTTEIIDRSERECGVGRRERADRRLTFEGRIPIVGTD